MGLENETPDLVDTFSIDARISKIYETNNLNLGGWYHIHFDPQSDLLFHKTQSLPQHPNGMRFTVFDKEGNMLATNEYFSVGGGFVVNEDTQHGNKNLYYKSYEDTSDVPVTRKEQSALLAALPFTNAQDLLDICDSGNMSIADVVWKNEMQWRTPQQIHDATLRIWHNMNESIKNGMTSQQIYLPGPLQVKRRAPSLFKKLVEESHFIPSDVKPPNFTSQSAIGTSPASGVLQNQASSTLMPSTANQQNHQTKRKLYALDWLSLFAISVNEENAAGGRVVTAPTNGAAGVIPSVLKYYLEFIAPVTTNKSNDTMSQNIDIIKFLHTAAAIGMLYKRGASISAAEVGCQGEVGVACSMSAAALTAVMGGTVRQVENAAEIGMEHNLGCK